MAEFEFTLEDLTSQKSDPFVRENMKNLASPLNSSRSVLGAADFNGYATSSTASVSSILLGGPIFTDPAANLAAQEQPLDALLGASLPATKKSGAGLGVFNALVPNDIILTAQQSKVQAAKYNAVQAAPPSTTPSSSGSSSAGGSSGSSSAGGTGETVPVPGDLNIQNTTDFANALLTALGAPLTAPNVHSIVAWENVEGGHWHNNARYNPLNTTQPMPGYTKTGTQGDIGAYTSWQQGVQATVITLTNGLYNDIVAALRSGSGLGNGHYASLLTWSGGGYDHI